MKMEKAAIAKKLWRLIRVGLYLLRKSKLFLLLKRTPKLAGKAFHSLLLLSGAVNSPHRPSFSSSDVVFGLRHYEFSCSNSPATAFCPPKLHRRYRYHLHEAAATVKDSPEVALPGFGRSPAAACRQLRVTDSPFPLKESETEEEAVKVNKAAEEFINKFYMDLMRQKNLAS